jgi:predicted MFS family arabinose efflux permease
MSTLHSSEQDRETDNTRWMILGLLFVARTGLGLQFQTVGSVADNLAQEFGFNYTQIGTLIGLFMVPGIFLAIPAGFAGHFMSDRFVIGLGLIVLAVGGGMAAIAEGFGLLGAARVVSGAGFVVSTIFLTKVVADWFGGKELATAMSVLVVSWPFGIALGQVGHGWLALNFDWRMAFAVASLYCLVSAFLVVLVKSDSPTKEVVAPSGALSATPKKIFAFNLNRHEVTLTLIAASIWALFNAGYVVYLSFAPRVLVASGFDEITALSITSLASWVLIFSGALCGVIVDRTGKADLVLYVCMGAAILALALTPLAPMAIATCVIFGLLGMAPAGVIMALTGEAMRPQNRAIGMGVFFSVYFLVQSPAPAIAGWLFDMTGDAYNAILFALILFLATGIANWIFRIVQKRGEL